MQLQNRKYIYILFILKYLSSPNIFLVIVRVKKGQNQLAFNCYLGLHCRLLQTTVLLTTLQICSSPQFLSPTTILSIFKALATHLEFIGLFSQNKLRIFTFECSAQFLSRLDQATEKSDFFCMCVLDLCPHNYLEPFHTNNAAALVVKRRPF